MDPNHSSKEWKLIEKTMQQLTAESRRSRRWGVFFKSLTFLYLFVLLAVYAGGGGGSLSTPDKFTGLVDVRGVIQDGAEASADVIVTGLRAAYEAPGLQGIVLRINSPGGSPVQAGYVYDEIKRLRVLHPEIPVYSVISDLGASGAYYIAAATDEIYADKASLVGSIGVVAPSFGFVDAMEKLGVERRLYTAGDHKGFLDPFSKEKEEEVEFWKGVLNTTHQQFISKVKEGRGERLESDETLFSGLVWSGEQAVDKGLIDGLRSTGYVAREIIGAEEIVDFTPQPSALDRFAESIGVSIGNAVGRMVLGGPSPLQ